MTRDEMVLLAEYNAWADGRIAERAATLEPEAQRRDLGSSIPTLRGTCFHIMNAAHVWVGRMRGEPRPNLDPSEIKDFAGLRARWARVDRELVELAAAEDPDRRQAYEASGGTRHVQPIWQMLLHVVNHSTHHRGQAITLLRQLGQPPVGDTDFSVFARQQR